MVWNHRIEDVIRWSTVQLNSGKYQNVPLQQFHLADRVNYPQNCFRLNLSLLNEVQQESIRTLQIVFNTTKIEKVQVNFQGASLIANREIYDNAFDTTGDAIVAEPGTRVTGVGLSTYAILL